MTQARPTALVALDTGGTFTDAVTYDPLSREVRSAKALTTYGDLTDGIIESARAASADLEAALSLKHGTTQVINALLQRDGARCALVTTAGFRDVLTLRRGNRPVAFDLGYQPDPPLVERALVFELDERLSATGEVLVAPSSEQVNALASRLRSLEVTAVAVSFINAYVDPVNELAVVAQLRDQLPDDIWVIAGTASTREWYEYERTSTAVADAYVAPRVSKYVSALEGRLGEEGFGGALYLMASHGGVLPASQAVAEPTALVESGPIGGVIGAQAYAEALGLRTVLAFDMGGTTAKCAIVHEGSYDVVSTYYVGGYEQGFPIRTRVLDIAEVGSGGGSIASVDREGRLSVGPRSAGSDPGPVAFGRGGEEPTVTDANLLLGRIAPGSFLNGAFSLDLDRAAAALQDKVGRPLGYGEGDIEVVAQGIVDMATLTMVSGIKKVSIERGFDLTDVPIFVFGGGGPLHGVELADEVGASTVIVPPLAGNFAAVGMLMADLRIDDVRTYSRGLDDEAVAGSSPLFEAMERDAVGRLREAADGPCETSRQRFAGIRFVGQRQELNIPVHENDSADDLRRRYVEAYSARFGHAGAAVEVEFTVLRTQVTAATEHLTPEALAGGEGSARAEPPGTRPHRRVVFGGEAHEDVPVLRREAVPRGDRQTGPLVVEEYGATTLVPPDWSLEIGRLGEMWIRRNGRR